MHAKKEGAAIRVASTARVPIAVGARPETIVFSRQALEGGINGLLFGRGETDGVGFLAVLAFLPGEDLRPQHAGVGDASKAINRFVLCA